MDASTKTILIIDDNAAMRALLEAHLRRAGYQVIDAFDGRSGIKKARDEKPDLVICDLMMPDVGGYDVLEALQQDPTLKDVPFFMLTAVYDDQVKAKGLARGAQDVFPKPFPMKQILAALEEHLAHERKPVTKPLTYNPQPDTGKLDTDHLTQSASISATQSPTHPVTSTNETLSHNRDTTPPKTD